MKLNILFLIFVFIFSNILYAQNIIQESEEHEIILQEIEVKEGQTLSYISNYYLKDPKLWPELLKYNTLTTSDIYAPLPGIKLKVPIILVKEKFRPAHLTYILNKVKTRKKDFSDWIDAKINMELYNDDSLITQDKSRANIKFFSGEILTVEENSFITIRPELKQEEVTLLQGGVRASKAKVITENATITPKADPNTKKIDYKTKIKDDKTTLVEVYEGLVDVSAQGKTVVVPKGFGTEIKPLSPPSVPKELPPPPELAIYNIPNIKISENNELILNNKNSQLQISLIEPQKLIPTTESIPLKTKSDLQEQSKLSFQTSYQEIDTKKTKPKTIGKIIKKYRILVSKDPEFKRIVYDETKELSADGRLSMDLTKIGIPDGKYFYKISYIDELGFESDSAIKSFVLDTTPPMLQVNISSGTKTDTELFNITGITESSATLKVNDRIIEVEPDGKFFTSIVLKLGINNITFISKDHSGNETKLVEQVELVKKLTKEEKEELKKLAVKEEKNRNITGNLLATFLSIGIIVGVLLFFLR